MVIVTISYILCCVTDNLAAMMGDLDMKAEARAVTGVLASHPDARDVQINSLSITFHGAELLTDTNCELNNGRRYGLIGTNGCGESGQTLTCETTFWYR